MGVHAGSVLYGWSKRGRAGWDAGKPIQIKYERTTMLWFLILLILIAGLFGGFGNAGTWGWSPLGIVILILIIWLFTRGRGNGPVV